jgi:all-trans-retinol dehydrogenase (NAD+)
MTALHNKHVLVTGGASGIGRLLVLGCARSGAAVTIWDLDEAGAERVALEALEAGATSAYAFACDVSDREQVYARAAEVRETAGDVDVLINNAGIVSGRPLLELPDDKIERTFGVNTLALFWTTKAFLPAMKARGSGHVVTVASAAGLIGTARETDYAASKFAAIGFSEALRMELRRSSPGVRTTVVCPYYIDTGMFAGTRTRFPLLLPILKEQDVADRILRAIRRNSPKLEMPPMVSTLPLMRMLPVWAFDQLADFFGLNNAMDDFTGRAATGQGEQQKVTAGSAGGRATRA